VIARRRPAFSARREVALGLGTYAVCLLVSAAAVRERGRRAAVRNAERIVALERRAGIALEPTVQGTLLPRRPVMLVADVAYVTLNVGLTVGWLGLLFGRRDPAYHRLRNAWAIATLGAQPVYLALPTAPPRALDGFTDTVRERGLDLDSGLVAHLYDPIAAMPSIHMAYAVIVAAAIAQTARTRALRRLAPAYPPAVAVVVIATANHYVLDVAAGTLLGAAALRAAAKLERRLS
jgi:hypothetical protein